MFLNGIFKTVIETNRDATNENRPKATLAQQFLSRFQLLKHFVEIVEENVGVVRLEDEGGAQTHGLFAAASSLNA